MRPWKTRKAGLPWQLYLWFSRWSILISVLSKHRGQGALSTPKSPSCNSKLSGHDKKGTSARLERTWMRGPVLHYELPLLVAHIFHGRLSDKIGRASCRDRV